MNTVAFVGGMMLIITDFVASCFYCSRGDQRIKFKSVSGAFCVMSTFIWYWCDKNKLKKSLADSQAS